MEATLQYDEAVLRRAAYAFWRRKLGKGYWISFAALIVVAVPVFAWAGVAGWFIAVLATLCAIGVVFGLWGFVVARRGARAAFRKLDPPRAQVSLADDAFTVTTSQGTSTLKWSAVTELWRDPEYTLVFFAEDTFSVLPTAGAPPQFHDAVAERVRAAGGKVL